MTDLVFRSSPERVSAFRELLSNPILAEAIVCLKDSGPSPVVAQHADAIESVRVQSKLEQHEADVNLLLSLAEPLQVVEHVEEEATFGVDRSQFK